MASGAAGGAEHRRVITAQDDPDREAYLAARARAGLSAKIADDDAWHQVAASLATSPRQLPSARAA